MWSWSVIRPKQTANHVVNPSFEASALGWTVVSSASGDNPTISAAQSYRGSAALCLPAGATTTSGDVAATQVVPVVNTEDAAYASCYVYLTAAETEDIGLDVLVGATHYRALASPLLTGQWQRVSVALPATGVTHASVTVAAYCSHLHATTAPVYWECFQIEDGNSISTYFDGDEAGCWWTGRAHYSASFRPLSCRTGGIAVPLSTYIHEQSMQGWGRAPMTAVTLPFGLQGGSLFQRAIKQERQATIVGSIVGGVNGMDDLHNAQAALGRLFGQDLSRPQALTRMLYDSGYAGGVQLAADVIYESGLEFDSLSGLTLTSIPIRVLQPDPTMVDLRERSVALGHMALSTQTVMYQPAGGRGGYPGAFQDVPGTLFGGGSGSGVKATALGWISPSTGNPQIWIATNATLIGGTATGGIFTIDVAATPPVVDVTEIGPGGEAGGEVLAIQQCASGDYVWIGGSFSGGLYDHAGTLHWEYPYLARERLSDNSMDGPIASVNDAVRAMAYLPSDDVLYVGGYFTAIPGIFAVSNPNGSSPSANAVQWGELVGGSFTAGLPGGLDLVYALAASGHTLFAAASKRGLGVLHVLMGVPDAPVPTSSLANTAYLESISDTVFSPSIASLVSASTPWGDRLYASGTNSLLGAFLVTIDASESTVLQSSFIGTAGGICISPDGRTLYIAAYNSWVTVVDLSSGAISGTIAVTNSAASVAISPDGNHLYVGENHDTEIIRLNDGSLVGTVSTGADCFSCVASADGSYVYVLGNSNQIVYQIETSGYTVTGSVSVNTSSSGYDYRNALSVSPGGDYVYHVDHDTSSLSAIATAGMTIAWTVALPSPGEGSCVTPDGKYVAVTCESNLCLVEVSTQVLTVVGGGAASKSCACCVRPGSGDLYVAGYNSGTIDLFAAPSGATNWETIGIVSRATSSHVPPMYVARDGTLYLSSASAGTLNPGGVAMPGLAKYSGGGWELVCAGVVNSIAEEPDGTIHLTGALSWPVPGSIHPNLTEYAIYDGSRIVTRSALTETTYYGSLVTIASNGTVVLISDSDLAGSAVLCPIIYSIPVVISYQGTAPAPVRVVLQCGEYATYVGSVANERTGQVIYFTNMQLAPGETLTIDTTPGSASVTSDISGNLASYVDPSSNLSSFVLLEGENYISVMTSSTLASAHILYHNHHYGIDGAGSNPGTASFVST